MVDSLRVEAPDEGAAIALVDSLHGQHVEIAPSPRGGCEIVVDLDGSPERAVVEMLHAIDGWLVAAGLAGTRVTLDGRTYTLTPKD
jgi:hypothetical protein